jgi:hypothetical protein
LLFWIYLFFELLLLFGIICGDVGLGRGGEGYLGIGSDNKMMGKRW